MKKKLCLFHINALVVFVVKKAIEKSVYCRLLGNILDCYSAQHRHCLIEKIGFLLAHIYI